MKNLEETWIRDRFIVSLIRIFCAFSFKRTRFAVKRIQTSYFSNRDLMFVVYVVVVKILQTEMKTFFFLMREKIKKCWLWWIILKKLWLIRQIFSLKIKNFVFDLPNQCNCSLQNARYSNMRSRCSELEWIFPNTHACECHFNWERWQSYQCAHTEIAQLLPQNKISLTFGCGVSSEKLLCMRLIVNWTHAYLQWKQKSTLTTENK